MANEKKEQPYHVSDLTGDQVPDPLGDSSLSAQERATAGVEHANEGGKASSGRNGK